MWSTPFKSRIIRSVKRSVLLTVWKTNENLYETIKNVAISNGISIPADVDQLAALRANVRFVLHWVPRGRKLAPYLDESYQWHVTSAQPYNQKHTDKVDALSGELRSSRHQNKMHADEVLTKPVCTNKMVLYYCLYRKLQQKDESALFYEPVKTGETIIPKIKSVDLIFITVPGAKYQNGNLSAPARCGEVIHQTDNRRN